jgi:hypothetical protein
MTGLHRTELAEVDADLGAKYRVGDDGETVDGKKYRAVPDSGRVQTCLGSNRTLIPPDTATGEGSVIVRSGTPVVTTVPGQFYPVTLAWFSANGDGQGTPVGTLLRVKADGT